MDEQEIKQESFDLEEVYDTKIYPLMKQILDVCKEHKMPMFATFLYLNNLEDEQDGVCTSHLMPKERPIPDKFLALHDFAKKTPALRLRTRNAEGQIVNETVVL